ncbi:ribonuclease H1 [Microthyrium microscopicum]|uniref:ribonuclease H n=1 Tax=Microthyrium microscopicum TaxID=703497 RepID=A0A6A6U194_9PEZI|nr:ribonuclease H1 [Microthyrium microscopicum]
MPYRMDLWVDGGCRGNGTEWAIGAAACVHKKYHGGHDSWTRHLPSYPTPTNQRAEITAIIMAQEQALEKFDELNGSPDLDIRIYSDSRYAVGCLTRWIYTWANNGWCNSRGYEVCNRDLIEEASDLDDRLNELGDVEYIWVPRSQNELADEYCNDALDEQ